MTLIDVRDVLKDVSAAAADCGSGTPEMDEAVELLGSLLAVWDAAVRVAVDPKHGDVLVYALRTMPATVDIGTGRAVTFQPGRQHG